MTQYVVWMDSEKADLFNMKSSGVEKSQVNVHGADHHSRSKKDLNDAHSEHFYKDLAVQLKDAEQILLIGPGHSKNHFKTHLETHHTAGLASKIVGMETADHPTDNQIVALASKFFSPETPKQH